MAEMNYCRDCAYLKWTDTCFVLRKERLDPVDKLPRAYDLHKAEEIRKTFILQGNPSAKVDYWTTPCPRFVAK